MDMERSVKIMNTEDTNSFQRIEISDLTRQENCSQYNVSTCSNVIINLTNLS